LRNKVKGEYKLFVCERSGRTTWRSHSNQIR